MRSPRSWACCSGIAGPMGPRCSRVIRTNLSTRPFYNERAVHAWLLLMAALVAIATVFNVTRVLRYSRSDTQLAGEATRDENRAADLRQQAARLRATVDPKQIDYASNEARQANDLIDRRTFSWTELFNKFETTLPDEARITSVRPQIDKQRGIILNIAVVSCSSTGSTSAKPGCWSPCSRPTTRRGDPGPPD